ncbi:hypothetical protein H4219_004127 [Mycoemilia scoparia]|uniref:Uncharacterized protein n=1 Tax=Mycoemilia scoparia TaxID=417184 RepID=A0A9W8DRW8_9FUNG|nr:hypothetical protein H4219_004127 [Mycoemilia scoparia]
MGKQDVFKAKKTIKRSSKFDQVDNNQLFDSKAKRPDFAKEEMPSLDSMLKDYEDVLAKINGISNNSGGSFIRLPAPSAHNPDLDIVKNGQEDVSNSEEIHRDAKTLILCDRRASAYKNTELTGSEEKKMISSHYESALKSLSAVALRIFYMEEFPVKIVNGQICPDKQFVKVIEEVFNKITPVFDDRQRKVSMSKIDDTVFYERGGWVLNTEIKVPDPNNPKNIQPKKVRVAIKGENPTKMLRSPKIDQLDIYKTTDYGEFFYYIVGCGFKFFANIVSKERQFIYTRRWRNTLDLSFFTGIVHLFVSTFKINEHQARISSKTAPFVSNGSTSGVNLDQVYKKTCRDVANAFLKGKYENFFVHMIYNSLELKCLAVTVLAYIKLLICYFVPAIFYCFIVKVFSKHVFFSK